MASVSTLPDSFVTNETHPSSLSGVTAEGVLSSTMRGAGEAYLSAYALYLNATAAQVGLIATLPALVGSFAQLLAAWWAERRGERLGLTIMGLAAQGFLWLPVIVLPLLWPGHAVALLLVTLTLYYGANHFANPLWHSLMGDLVPEDVRGRYFGERSRLMNFANFVALVSAALVLRLAKSHGHTEIGFVAIFTFAMLARLFSIPKIRAIREHALPKGRLSLHPAILWREMRGTQFSRFAIFTAVMTFSAGIAGPFYAVYMLRDLHFSYMQFMATQAVVVLSQVATLTLWGRLGDRFGNRFVLAVTGSLIPVAPMLWLATTHFGAILLIQLLNGLAWAGFNLSAGNFVYDSVPREKRSLYNAVHNILTAFALALGAGLGGFFAAHVPATTQVFGLTLGNSLLWVFLISGLARLNTALAFIPLLRELRTGTVAPRRRLAMLFMGRTGSV
ncbi:MULTISPECIES: MFS transporter [Acidiferrobacter]|jgi:MFS family permease|uniref:MFS transporter n=1 Tax=Acidiferrobacter thiooxydans TaxID=163359 RepID=A0A1C2G324_9GAMM|nr:MULTISPECIES: MFS transporter [Acidiferrobacter]MDA8190295.1 MFS transporter [Gammaproteobacteria bacterium]RCN56167.1 MFS transporter [Acidiferrobacter thiooxydans]UEN98550.1 MFS transporter [Acidiferrobacter thiooxydans]